MQEGGKSFRKVTAPAKIRSLDAFSVESCVTYKEQDYILKRTLKKSNVIRLFNAFMLAGGVVLDIVSILGYGAYIAFITQEIIEEFNTKNFNIDSGF